MNLNKLVNGILVHCSSVTQQSILQGDNIGLFVCPCIFFVYSAKELGNTDGLMEGLILASGWCCIGSLIVSLLEIKVHS